MTQRHVKMTQKPQLKNINPTHYLQTRRRNIRFFKVLIEITLKTNIQEFDLFLSASDMTYFFEQTKFIIIIPFTIITFAEKNLEDIFLTSISQIFPNQTIKTASINQILL